MRKKIIMSLKYQINEKEILKERIHVKRINNHNEWLKKIIFTITVNILFFRQFKVNRTVNLKLIKLSFIKKFTHNWCLFLFIKSSKVKWNENRSMLRSVTN